MGRRRTRISLNVLVNNRLVGRLTKATSGAIEFEYLQTWLEWKHAFPISLSLPLREEKFTGDAVTSVFENLLPDSDDIRQHVAERVGAIGNDAYSLLSAIGRDCVGALQFLSDEHLEQPGHQGKAGIISGEPVTDEEIANILKNLGRAPLGLTEDDNFRISMAGAQEKTALLFHKGQWYKPSGTTATTHIFKPPIGQLPGGIDLTNSVENEFYCLELMEAFGLKTNTTKIETFADEKVLVIERFDRQWTEDGRLLRLPQEDLCQALSVQPTRKYQNQGGPNIVDILDLLRGSDTPEEDQIKFLKAQVFFWLIGATDGHAKNFSVFLSPGGAFRLTPFYDVLTAQPSLDRKQLQRKQMKLAMSVGNSSHYRFDQIEPRHFFQTVKRAKLPERIAVTSLQEIAEQGEVAFEAVEKTLPIDFPTNIHESVQTAALHRLEVLKGGLKRTLGVS